MSHLRIDSGFSYLASMSCLLLLQAAVKNIKLSYQNKPPYLLKSL